MTKRILVGLLLATGVFGIAATASADPNKKDNEYGYVFNDDILNADGKSANGAQITVLRFGRRDRLLRPRVHFVTEMLKSVENM